MNVEIPVTITVAPMPTALTLLEAMIVPVILDTLEMASYVMVCFLLVASRIAFTMCNFELLRKLHCHLFCTFIFRVYMLLKLTL